MNLYNAAWAIPLLFLIGGVGSLGVETHRRAAQLCVFFSALAFIAAAFVLGVRLTHDAQPAFELALDVLRDDSTGGCDVRDSVRGTDRHSC